MSPSSIGNVGPLLDEPRTPWAVWGWGAALAILGTVLLCSALPGINWLISVLAVSVA